MRFHSLSSHPWAVPWGLLKEDRRIPVDFYSKSKKIKAGFTKIGRKAGFSGTNPQVRGKKGRTIA